MKKLLIPLVLAVVVALATTGASAGNGAPSGAHYTLNIIGVAKDKTASMTDSERHVIFVKLWGTSKIGLAEGDFSVLDGNGTDGNGARFQLPNPDPDGDGVTSYSVYARALGKPGGSSETQTCVTDVDESYWCSVESMVLVRGHGKSSFTNVSSELLTVYADPDGDGVYTRESLFSDATHSYYWDYTNSGLRHAQLRFYEVPTTIA